MGRIVASSGEKGSVELDGRCEKKALTWAKKTREAHREEVD